jgi:hypothetical protein
VVCIGEFAEPLENGEEPELESRLKGEVSPVAVEGDGAEENKLAALKLDSGDDETAGAGVVGGTPWEAAPEAASRDASCGASEEVANCAEDGAVPPAAPAGDPCDATLLTAGEAPESAAEGAEELVIGALIDGPAADEGEAPNGCGGPEGVENARGAAGAAPPGRDGSKTIGVGGAALTMPHSAAGTTESAASPETGVGASGAEAKLAGTNVPFLRFPLEYRFIISATFCLSRLTFSRRCRELVIRFSSSSIRRLTMFISSRL